MALKLSDDVTRVAHHIDDGAVTMYAVDANQAVARHPLEWSHTPWDPQVAAENRRKLHETRVAVAEAHGHEPPAPPVEPEYTDEERELIEAHRARVAEAKKLLAEAEAEEAAARDRDAKIAEAKAVVQSPGPQLAPRLTGLAKVNAERKAAAAARAKAEAEDSARAESAAKAKKD